MGPAKALGGLQQNNLRHPFGILRNLAVPEPDHRPTFGLKPARPRNIGLALRMLSAVYLDSQLRLATRQIDDERPHHQLPRKCRPVAGQQPPQGSFCLRGARSKGTGTAGHFRIDAVHATDLPQRALRAHPPLTPPWKGGEWSARASPKRFFDTGSQPEG